LRFAIYAPAVRRSFGPAWFSLALPLFLIVAPSAHAEIVPLVLSEEVAPDGNGTFSTFGLPTLNANGQVAVVGVLTGTQSPPNDTRGIYLLDGQSVTQLVRGGDPAPDGNGVFSDTFSYDGNLIERLALNASGTVAFLAQLDGTAGGSTFDDSGLFTANASGVTQLVRLGDPAPDGNGVFGPQDPTSIDVSLLPPGIDDSGDATFFGVLFETSAGEGSDDEGVFRADGTTLTQIARTTGLEPLGVVDPEISFLSPQIASNAAGEVVLNASLPFDPMVFPPPADLERLYVYDGAALTEVARSGTAVSGGTLTFFGDVILAESGNVVFQAFVDAAVGFDGTALFLTDGLTLTEVARQFEVGPGEIDFEFNSFFGIDVNDQDQVALSASLERNAVPPDNRTTGIYRYDGGTGLVRLVRQGDPAPDGNGTFGELDGPVFLNEHGAVAFGASLTGTANPPNDLNGIFVVEPNGSVRQVVRQGQPLEGSTVFSPGFLGSSVFFDTDDLALAGMTALNDAGQVAFTTSLADGRWGVFITPVPEPSSGALAVAALTTVAALRRRAAR
jgi:hypothetical protein